MGERKSHISVFQRVPLTATSLPEGEVNVEDAAAFLNVSGETVRRWIAEGRLRANRVTGARGRAGWQYTIPTPEVIRLRQAGQRPRTAVPA